MASLKNTEVYRAGSTAPHYNFETKRCAFDVNEQKGTVNIRFDLASAGGGTTVVWLCIGKDDLESILHEIAEKMPDQVGFLSDCAAVANKKNLEALHGALSVHDSERARAKLLVEKLGKVEKFVIEKYNQAPFGEDDRESAVRDQLGEVIKNLRSIS